MLALDILLQFIGAFYMFAGIVLARAVMMDRFLTDATNAISAVTGGTPSWRDRLRASYALLLAVMTFVSGLGLMSLCDIAVYMFIATMLLQALFLFWIAPQYLDTPDVTQSRGRQQSINALVVYGAATAFVTWAASHGRLQPVAEANGISMLMSAGVLALFLGYIAWMWLRARVGKPL